MSRRALVGAVLATAMLITGCNPLNDPLPSEVRIVVGGDGPGPFVLVTSNQFLGTGPGAGALTFGAADTVVVDIGFDEAFALGPRDRIYVALSRPDGSGVTPSVSLRVLLVDETICLRDAAALSDDPLECLYLG